MTIEYNNAIAFPNITWSDPLITIAILSDGSPKISAKYKDRLQILTNGSIIVTNATLSDSGSYTVKIETVDEQPENATVQVNVYEAIQNVSVSFIPLEVKEGDAFVTLTCQVTSGTGTIQWTKDGHDVGRDSRYLILDKTLNITQPNRTDSGLFSCNITNPWKSMSGSATLTVYYGPEIQSVTVEADSKPFSQDSIFVNSNVNITCSAVSYPEAEYSWILSNSTTIYAGPILHLPNIQFSQAGRYSCLARNNKTALGVNASVAIHVYETIGNMSVVSNPVEVKEGDASVTLTCQTTSVRGAVNWTKDGGNVGANSKYSLLSNTLTIAQPNRTDSGVFSCFISNPLSNSSGSLNLTIIYGPANQSITLSSDTKPFTQENVLVNSNVNLACSAVSYPEAEYSWILSSSSDPTVPKGPILPLPKIQLAQSGKYICLARNSKTNGQVQTAITITVLETISKVSIVSNPVEVKEGDASVTLTCQTTSVSGAVSWTKDGGNVAANSKYSVLDNTLKIAQPHRTDSGVFSCIITNPLSNSSGSLNLTIAYGPETQSITLSSDTKPFTQGYVLVNSNVNLTCSAASYPEAEYSWILSSSSDPTVPKGPILPLPKIQLAQSGKYFCLARNSKSNSQVQTAITITVLELPVQSPECGLKAVNNTALLFTCLWSNISPKPNLSFNGLSDSTSSDSFSLEALVTSTTVLSDLSGKIITCIGKYILPDRNRNCTVTPEAPSVSGIAMHASSGVDGIISVTLTFTGTFYPFPVVEWFGPDDHQLCSGSKYIFSSNNITLTIYNFTLEQNLGNYSFKCQNPLGGKTQALKLTVPSVSSCTVTRSGDGRSAAIDWTVPGNSVLTNIVVQMQGTPLTRAATTDWQNIASKGSGNGSYTAFGMIPSESYSFRVTPMFGNTSGTPSEAQAAKPTTLSGGAIAGIVVGSVLGFLLLILLLVLLLCCIRKQKGKQGLRPPTPIADRAKMKSKQANGREGLKGKTLADPVNWNKASISSSTLTNGPGAYKTHNAMFRNTSLSTISDNVSSNGAAAHSNNSTATGSKREKGIRATTVV